MSDQVAKRIISKVIRGLDYRIEVTKLIDEIFLQFVNDFFKSIVDAKMNCKDITIDWYKQTFSGSDLPKDDIACNSGVNMKTISELSNKGTKEVVLQASIEQYETLGNAIKALIKDNNEINVIPKIEFHGVSVKLTLAESLIVINALAIKREALREGLWSTAGKTVEKPLIRTLCILFNVPIKYYDQSKIPESLREVDFYLIDKSGQFNRCEVKLMGKGNPESADVIHARDTQVFIADKLSGTNKKQLDDNDVYWVELRSKDGYKRFLTVLKNLCIPGQDFTENIARKLNDAFSIVFA
jgi:hypothetical protein